jgi:cell division ATPase FtsA
VYSVPAQAIDADMPPVTYHERVFNKIFSALGYTARPLNEAMAIVFAECEKENFSGITISFGCGLTNVACAYKGVPIFTFSVKRGGDYIDQFVAKSLNMPVTKITALKESKLSLNSLAEAKNKREKQALQALVFAYQDLISYCIDRFVKKFASSSENIDLDEAIPIVVSGGTSCPPGFLDLFKEVFSERKDFPYEISEIRQTDNPLGSVATGCLIYCAWKEGIEKKG